MMPSILSRTFTLATVLLASTALAQAEPVADEADKPVADKSGVADADKPVAEDEPADKPDADKPKPDEDEPAGPAVNAPPKPPSPSSAVEGKAQAREHFLRGKSLQGEGKHAEAAIAYQSAHEAFFMPVMVFNIAQALRLAGDYETALARYEEYLRLEPEGNGATHAAEFITELKVILAEASDAITAADGPDGPPSPELLEIDTRSVALLEPAEWLTQTPDRPDTGKPARVAGIVLGTAGLAGLAAATYWALEAHSTEKDLDGFQGEWGTKQLELQRNGEDQSRFAVVAGSIGAILMFGGGGLYYWGRAGKAEATLSLQTSSGTGFALSGTF